MTFNLLDGLLVFCSNQILKRKILVHQNLILVIIIMKTFRIIMIGVTFFSLSNTHQN